MKKITVQISFFFTVIFFSGCYALRSAEGLSGGELNVSYVTPLAGSVRYGISDNIESRLMVVFNNLNYDIYLHTNKDSSVNNYGLTIGASNAPFRKPEYFMGFTIGGKCTDYFSPYISIIHKSSLEDKKEWNYISIGSEFKYFFSNKKTLSILFTPEITLSTEKILKDIYNDYIIGTISFGVTFDVYKLFND